MRHHRACAAPAGRVDLESEVARAGLPVIEQLAEDLGDSAICIELTDARANVIGRVVGSHGLAATLDRIGASVAAPITDPRRDVPVGAVGVTCAIPDASALMLALAQLAARTISERMVDSATVGDRALLEQFLRARRHTRGPVLAINNNELLTNAAASRLVKPSDHTHIWNWVLNVAESNRATSQELRLGTQTVSASCEVVRTGSVMVGALVYVEELRPASLTRADRRARSTGRQTFGWQSLRPAELGIAELVAEGLTNREIAARIFLSPHTVDSHLRHIYRKLSINTRIELTRLVLEHGAASVDGAAETLAG